MPQQWTPEVVVSVVAGLAVGVAVLAMGLAAMHRRRISERMQLHAIVARYSGPGLPAGEEASAARRRPATELAQRLTPARSRRRMRRQLAEAGMADADALERLMRRKLLGLLAGLAFGLLIGWRMGGAWWLAVPVAAIGGYFLPEFLVIRAGDQRTEELRRDLPDALDLMQLCVGSGLSLQSALEQVAATQTGPVSAELGRVLQEMQIGSSRMDAFIALTHRVRQPDLLNFAHAIIQVDRLGIPISTVLDEQAREMREKRQASAEEQAQKVSVKILMPLVVCFLPALFLMVIGPAVLRLVSTLGS